MDPREIKRLEFFDEGLDTGSDSSSSDDDSSEDEPNNVGGSQESEDSSSSDSDENDMEVDMAEFEAKLTNVKEKLLMDPYNYDLLTEKIVILRKLGDLDALREAREKMSMLYPLTGKLWLDWIQDEQKLTETAEEKAKVKDLFERAINDYVSVEVWSEYIQFALGEISNENGIENCRHICERALAAAGLHASLGSLLWDAYRDFEAAVLGLATNDEERDKQEKRYVNLCQRYLAVPLLGLEEAFAEISAKISIDEPTEAAYSSAVAKLRRIEGLEQELISAEDSAAKATVYRKYVQAEKADKSNPARIQCVFERAISDCPLDYTLWLEYLHYVNTALKIPEVILAVAERASRNYPYAVDIWAAYFVAVENYKPTDLIGVFEKAIAYFQTPDEAGRLWIKYLECLRRLLRVKDFPKEDCEKFVSNTKLAENHVLQLVNYAEPNEFVFQFAMMRIRLNIIQRQSTTDAREDWKDLLERGYGTSFRHWYQYLLLENKHGDLTSYRQQLSRATAYVTDDLHSIATLWLDLERDHGDVNQLKTCETKINKYLQQLAEALSEVSEQNTALPNKEEPKSWKELKNDRKKRKAVSNQDKVPEKRSKKEDVPDGVVFKTPAIPGPSTSKQPQKQTQKEEVVQEKVKHDHSKDDRTVFVSNLDFSMDEDGIKDFFAETGSVEEVRLVKNFLGKSKGFAYVVFTSEESVTKALARDRQPLGKRPVFVSPCDPDPATRPVGFKFSDKLEKNKLFIRGLAVSITEEDLKNLFLPFGTVKDVRVVKHRNGYSKGCAYVDYEDEESARRATEELNDKEVQGKVITVVVSNPPKKGEKKELPSDMQILQRRPPTAFVPRSLQVTRTAPNSENGPKNLSNKDFRQFLIKK